MGTRGPQSIFLGESTHPVRVPARFHQAVRQFVLKAMIDELRQETALLRREVKRHAPERKSAASKPGVARVRDRSRGKTRPAPRGFGR